MEAWEPREFPAEDSAALSEMNILNLFAPGSECNTVGAVLDMLLQSQAIGHVVLIGLEIGLQTAAAF